MRSFVLVFGLVLSSIVVFSQISNFETVGGDPLQMSKYEKIEGSPYMNEGRWSIGHLYTINGTKQDPAPLRFNAFENQLEIKQDKDVLVLFKESLSSFELLETDPLGNDRSLLFRKVGPNNLLAKDRFMRVIFDSKDFSILEDVGVIKSKITPAAYGETPYDKFIPTRKTYFFRNGVLEAQRVSVKALQKIFPDKNVKALMKDHTLTLESEEDLGKLCNLLLQ